MSQRLIELDNEVVCQFLDRKVREKLGPHVEFSVKNYYLAQDDKVQVIVEVDQPEESNVTERPVDRKVMDQQLQESHNWTPEQGALIEKCGNEGVDVLTPEEKSQLLDLGMGRRRIPDGRDIFGTGGLIQDLTMVEDCRAWGQIAGLKIKPRNECPNT